MVANSKLNTLLILRVVAAKSQLANEAAGDASDIDGKVRFFLLHSYLLL